MTWQQALMEAMDEAEQHGYEMAKRGDPPPMPPHWENFTTSHGYTSANRHHEALMRGYERAHKEKH